jgi:transposase-like protein
LCVHICVWVCKMEKNSVKCPECGSTHIIKMGWRITRHGRKRRLQCQKCGRTFYMPEVPEQ